MVTRIVSDFYVTIAVPSVEEILSSNFSYPNYLESEIVKSLERNSGEKVKKAIDTRIIGELGEEYLRRRGRI